MSAIHDWPDAEPRELAEQARRAISCARVACLTTFPCTAPSRRHTTSVMLQADDDGQPTFVLTRDAAAVHHLQTHPFATVRVAPSGLPDVTVQGIARRAHSRDDGGLLIYRITVGAVHVGIGPRVPVPTRDYLAAQPDPLRGHAPLTTFHYSEDQP